MGKAIYQSLVGPILIEESDGFITSIDFVKDVKHDNLEATTLTDNTMMQLDEYFQGTRKVFDLPLNPKGTPFMRKVWAALQEIPYGKTASYQDIAKMVGCEKACRAVGGANNRNPIPIIIPCHRIIGKNGSLVGYGGGLEIKKTLLELESNNQFNFKNVEDNKKR